MVFFSLEPTEKFLHMLFCYFMTYTYIILSPPLLHQLVHFLRVFMREGRAMNNSVGFRFKLLGFILRRYYLLAGRYLTNHFLYLISSSVGFSIFERVNAYTSKSKISTQHLEYINKVECPFLGYIVHT